ncbi:MAG: hypothetical protein AVDCRST_MAG10-3061, partial [uncultured Acidimicrobiales bacterium]
GGAHCGCGGGGRGAHRRGPHAPARRARPALHPRSHERPGVPGRPGRVNRGAE